MDSLLSQIPLFKSLSESHRMELSQSFRKIKIQDGDTLINNGEEFNQFCVVHSGELEIARNLQSDILLPGDYFNVKSLITSFPLPYSVRSIKTTTLFTLSRDDLHSLFQKCPGMVSTFFSQFMHEELVMDKTSQSKIHSIPSTSSSSIQSSSSSNQITIHMFDAKQYQVLSFVEQNKKLNLNYKLEFISEKLSLQTVHLAQGASAICVFVHDSVNAEVAQELKKNNIQLVAYRCAGFDTCDVKACDDLGLSVVRVPSYSPNAIAEHAVALLMAVNRKLIQANSRIHNGDFSLDGLTGFNIRGKTVGVVGTGRIGYFFVQIMLGFGCRVICYDVFKNPSLLSNPAIQYVSLDQLFQESDIISLHAPLTPDTHYLVNESALEKMKDGVIILNTSRGPLIDTKALIEAIKSEKVGGCGLDVVEGEDDYFYENIAQHPIKNDLIGRLLSLNNVILTSHQAYLTYESLNEIATTTLKNIQEFFKVGKRMKSLTNSVNNVLEK